MWQKVLEFYNVIVYLQLIFPIQAFDECLTWLQDGVHYLLTDAIYDVLDSVTVDIGGEQG